MEAGKEGSRQDSPSHGSVYLSIWPAGWLVAVETANCQPEKLYIRRTHACNI